MSNTPNQPNRGVVQHDPRRANPTGAYIMTGGAVLFFIATFLDWLNNGEDTFSGYELDSLIPFTAYLGLGLAAALLYAAKRATRRQHRGLSLTSMAAGLAATGLALSFLIDAPGIVETGSDSDIGIYVALIGALVWTVGSFLLAKEPEGDIEHDDHHSTARTDSGRSTSSN
jgi:hypothetical protein